MTLSLRILSLIALFVAMLAVPSLAADPQAAVADEQAAEAAHAAGGTSLFDSPGAEQIATSVITLIIFLGLMAILAKFAWGPIVKSLEDREGRIRGDIEAAERARAASEKALAENQRQLDGAEQRVRDLIAQANADAQQLATRVKMQAQEDAEEIKERAQRDIEQTRRDAIESVRTEAGTLAVAIAEKILGREINADDQKQLIESSLDEMRKSGVEGETVTA